MLVDLVETGKTWHEAYRITYPEIQSKDGRIARVRSLRYHNKSFKKWLMLRGSSFGEKQKMSKMDLLDNVLEIANFNVASLYAKDEQGNIVLKPDWLEEAKQHNVLAKIRVTKKTRTKSDGSEETMEVIDIVPYSRDAALGRIARLLGYDDTATIPGNIVGGTVNNTTIINEIKQIRIAAKEGTGLDGTIIDDKFVAGLLDAEIVENKAPGEDGDDEVDETDQAQG